MGFDHHCPWFDADVIAKSTMASFLFFLVLAIALLLLALGPLAPRAYNEFRELISFAWDDQSIKRDWWDHRKAWYGGPTVRYGYALYLAQKRIKQAGSASSRTPSLHAPIVVLFALLVSSIAAGLLYTTTAAAVRGDLSVDIMRLRAFRAAQRSKKQDSLIEALSPTMFFWIPLSAIEAFVGPAEQIDAEVRHAGGTVVSTQTTDERPYDWGLAKNLIMFLE